MGQSLSVVGENINSFETKLLLMPLCTGIHKL